jgi:hypothetical protein
LNFSADDAIRLSHGQVLPLPAPALSAVNSDCHAAAFDPEGELIGIVRVAPQEGKVQPYKIIGK